MVSACSQVELGNMIFREVELRYQLRYKVQLRNEMEIKFGNETYKQNHFNFSSFGISSKLS